MVWLGGVSLGEILRYKNSLTRVQKWQGQEIHGELDCYDESSHSPRLAILLLYFKSLQCTHKNKDNLKYSMTVILALLKTIGDEGVTFIVDEEASEYFRSIWDKCESYKFKGVVVDPYLP